MLSDPHPGSGLPDLLTVEEAAAVLRIGRTAAYLLAKRDLAGGGSEGWHVVRVGRLLRVPRAALEALTGAELTGPASGPSAPSEACSTQADAGGTGATTATPAVTASSRRARSRDTAPSEHATQLDLFDAPHPH